MWPEAPRLAVPWAQAEIMEVQQANSGRSAFPTFLKRGPLPKAPPACAPPGQARLAPELCVAPADLRIGATVCVLGRQLFIYDCDDATRAWYKVPAGERGEGALRWAAYRTAT
jgi:hypothetical protein